MFDRPLFLGQVPIAGMGAGMSVSVPRARFLRRSRLFPNYNPYPYPYPYQYPQQPTELVCRSEKTESGEEIFRCRQEPYSADLICRKDKDAEGNDVLRCTQQQPAAYPGAYPVVNYPGY